MFTSTSACRRLLASQKGAVFATTHADQQCGPRDDDADSQASDTGHVGVAAGGCEAVAVLGGDVLVPGGLVDNLDLGDRLRHSFLGDHLAVIDEGPATLEGRLVLRGPVAVAELASRLATGHVVLGVAFLVHDGTKQRVAVFVDHLRPDLQVDVRVGRKHPGCLREVLGFTDDSLCDLCEVERLVGDVRLLDEPFLVVLRPALEGRFLELAGAGCVGRRGAILDAVLRERSDRVVVAFGLRLELDPRRTRVVLDPVPVHVVDGLLGGGLGFPGPFAGLLPSVTGAFDAPLVFPVGAGLDLLGHAVLGVLVRLRELAVLDAVFGPLGLHRVVTAGFQYGLVVERPLVAGRVVPFPPEGGTGVLPLAVRRLLLDDTADLLLVLVLNLVVVDRDLPLVGLDTVTCRDDLLELVEVREGLGVTRIGPRELVEVVGDLLLAGLDPREQCLEVCDCRNLTAPAFFHVPNGIFTGGDDFVVVEELGVVDHASLLDDTLVVLGRERRRNCSVGCWCDTADEGEGEQRGPGGEAEHTVAVHWELPSCLRIGESRAVLLISM